MTSTKDSFRKCSAYVGGCRHNWLNEAKTHVKSICNKLQSRHKHFKWMQCYVLKSNEGTCFCSFLECWLLTTQPSQSQPLSKGVALPKLTIYFMPVQLFCQPNPTILTSLQIFSPKHFLITFLHTNLDFRVCFQENKTKTAGTKGSPVMQILKMRTGTSSYISCLTVEQVRTTNGRQDPDSLQQSMAIVMKLLCFNLEGPTTGY